MPRPGAQPLRADHVVERYVDGELVLYDPVMQRVHALNPTAALIWQACDGTQDPSRIVASLAALYPENRREIDVDVPETLGIFRTAGLLRE